MDKLLTFSTVSDKGEPLLRPLNDGRRVLTKLANPMLPGVLQFMNKLQPDQDKLYLLLSALGTSEVWGANINGDFFNRVGLKHPRTEQEDWGYKTFEVYGHPFRHHKNQIEKGDKPYGEVHKALWNPRMERVELIVSLNRNETVQLAGGDLLDRLDRGDPLDISMGCKVPFDICSITNPNWKQWEYRCPKEMLLEHFSLLGLPYGASLKARLEAMRQGRVGLPGLAITTDEYSDWAKNQLGRTLPDGRLVYVVNLFPRFFDISFVFLGADKTAKVLAKLAKVYQVPSAYAALEAGMVSDNMDFFKREKTATPFTDFVKQSAEIKTSDIDKEIKSNLSEDNIQFLGAEEPAIPDAKLESLSELPLGNILSTLAGLGVALKPSEFQKIVVIKMGKPAREWGMSQTNQIFSPCKDMSPVGMSPEMFMPELGMSMSGLIPHRSAFLPVLKRRVAQIIVVKPQHTDNNPPAEEASTPLLDKISAAYNGYRDALIKTAASCVPIIEAIPEIYDVIVKEDLDDAFFRGVKLARVDPKLLTGLALFGIAPAIYLASAHQRKKQQEGKSLSGPGKLVAEYPLSTSAALTVGGVYGAKRTQSILSNPAVKKALYDLKLAVNQPRTF